MAALEIEPTEVEALAQEARAVIEERLRSVGGDPDAFWYAVSLIYRRGLAESHPSPEPLELAA